jgi:hypothetical protein
MKAPQDVTNNSHHPQFIYFVHDMIDNDQSLNLSRWVDSPPPRLVRFSPLDGYLVLGRIQGLLAVEKKALYLIK